MILVGFCQTCQKVKNVRVSNAGMVSLARGGVAVGQCPACADAEQQARRGGRRAR